MATAAANTPPAKPGALTPSNLEFPTRGHQRARSVSTGDEGSPNSFVFPRKAPSPSVTHSTRPRSGTTDAITLLAEIGVLPPPGTAAAARLRSPPTPSFPNRQRPVSMLVLPTQTLPSVTLAPAPTGRAQKGVTGDLPETDSPIIPAVVTKGVPTEEESPVKKAAGPPPGYQRRGHAHRRSGAISSSDVWNLLSQSTPSLPLQNSVPTPKADQPPATPEVKLEASVTSVSRPHNVPKQSWSAPVSPACGAIAIPPPSPTLLDVDKKGSKVAFTGRVETIPRPPPPVSPVGAHGGSIGDVVSPLIRNPVTPTTPATPPTPSRPRSNTRNRSSSISSSQSPLSPELQAQFAHITQRPSTAGAVLSPPISTEPVPPVPALRIETAVTPQSPTSPIEAEIPKSPTKLCAPEKSEKPEEEKRARKKSHKKALSDGSPQTSSPSSPELFGTATEKDDKCSSKTSKGDRKKKKKHLKNFLFGKGKHSKGGKTGRALKRSPTPPSRHNSFRKQGEMELPPAWTESYVIMPEGSMAGRSLEELSSTMSPRYPGSGSDRDSPIIDLDAAMGPFNSPVVGSGGRSSGGFSAAKRRMHSSGAGGKMSIVSGVISNSLAGTHRRSESMPEMGMPLFDLAEYAGMEMEDVFEEDEEDEEESSSGSDSGSETDESEDGDRQRMSTGGLGIGIQVTDGDGVTTWEEGVSVDWNNVPQGPRRSSLVPTLGSNGSLKNASIQEEDEPEEDTTATRPTSIFSHNNDSTKSQPPSPDYCSTPTSLVPSAQSSTSTVTPTSAVSTASTLPDTPATSCPSESMPMNMPLPSPPFAVPRTASPSSRRNSLTLKELVDLSLQEGSGFDPYADSEFRFLGEPGPEMRMSVSVEDVPSLTSSSSTMTSSYAAYCAAGILQQPGTPKIEEIPVGVVGSEVSVASGKGKDKDRGLKKKWSRVFKFWESEEKEHAHKEKKDKEHHGKGKEKEREEKVHKREDKAHKKEEKTHKKEKTQKEKREKKEKVKVGKDAGKETI